MSSAELAKPSHDFLGMDQRDLEGLSDAELLEAAGYMERFLAQHRKENAILYYEPVSETAWRVHQSTAKICGVSGGNRCLPLTEPVLMADGSLRPLGEIRVGDEVAIGVPYHRSLTAKVKTVFRSGDKTIWRFWFADGLGLSAFEASAEHHVPVAFDPHGPFRKRAVAEIIPILVAGVDVWVDTVNGRRRLAVPTRLDMRVPCGDIEVDHIGHCYVAGDGGVLVSNSSKTESCIAEIVMLATGMMPERFRTDPVFRSKFRGPIQARIVVESLINTLWPNIIPKFQWFRWLGPDKPGSDQGHWGWVPKACLVKGDWDRSFSKTERCLTMLCRNPDDPREILGESTIHFMSKDNDPEDFASGQFHIILEDEPPTEAIHKENKMRVQSVDGRILLAMTWPEDPTIPVTWIYDEIYDPGSPGPNKDPEIDWFELDSRDNKHQSAKGVEFNLKHMNEAEFANRVLGQPMRMASRVHPLFTDRKAWWCFDCKADAYVDEQQPEPRCKKCSSALVASYCHVTDQMPKMRLPVVYLLDPHPRKPHMMAWIGVTPDEDYIQLAEAQVDGTPGEVHAAVVEIERTHGLEVRARLMDPNMGRSAPGVQRSITWQAEFSSVGLRCALADDSAIGRQRINDLLQPDEFTMRPRISVHERCVVTTKQFKRYQWDNFKMGAERGVKEDVKQVDDDFPTLWKYFVNYGPSFRFLIRGAPILGRRERGARQAR